MQISWLLHLKHILDGATGNVNAALKAELQRDCVRSLSAQGQKSTPGKGGNRIPSVTAKSRLPSSAEELQGLEQAGQFTLYLSFLLTHPCFFS